MPLDDDLGGNTLVYRKPQSTVDIPWMNSHALPRQCVVWEGNLKSGDNDRSCILHKIVTIEDDVWGVVEEIDGSLRKVRINRLRLIPIGGKK